MKITNKSQRLIKVGTVVILPGNTVEVDATLEQYPALSDLAKEGDISVKIAKANTKETSKEETKGTPEGAKKSDEKDEEKDTEEGK